jgi:hypothetical protein
LLREVINSLLETEGKFIHQNIVIINRVGAVVFAFEVIASEEITRTQPIAELCSQCFQNICFCATLKWK